MTKRILLVAASMVAGACSTTPPAVSEAPPVIVQTPQASNGQLAFTLASGTYHCDLGTRVEVHRDTGDAQRIRIGWIGRDYELERNLSYSGLPRYEDRKSGLVWIDLPWKSVLLDGQRNRPLASECRPRPAA